MMRGFREHFSLWPVYSIPVLLSAISVIVTGKPNEASKLRALCVAEMRKVWECQINTKGPSFQFWELCKRRFHSIGGAPDRHGFIPFQDYVDISGKKHVYLLFIKAVPGTQLYSALLVQESKAVPGHMSRRLLPWHTF